jgi:hypothetical protein
LSREVKIWLNKPQRISWLIGAKEEYGVWGRSTGKTQGPIAQRSSHAANLMPRGATGIVGTTYVQLLDRTLPPLLKGWESLGYEENVHFWRRRFPPKTLNIPSAIYPVLTPEHSIFWWNGHVFHLISQDRPGLANGKNLDAIICDEARFLNHARYMDDIAPTNRGNREIFGHLAEHHMITMFTDMPTTPKGKWILEKSNQVDQEKIKQIINIQLEYNKLKAELSDPAITPGRCNYIKRQLSSYAYVLNELRKDSVWYSEASSLDNIQVLGVAQFKQWRREMEWPEFQSSILNKRVVHSDNGFYSLLDTDVHAYDDFDYGYIEGQSVDLPNGSLNDCRKDRDLIKNKPLEIALDYNAAINSLVIGQEIEKYFRVLKSMFVTSNEKKILPDLIDDFCAYYRYHNCHEVYYYYDHTAIGTDSTRLESLADIVSNRLMKNGWTVRRCYVGQQPRHDIRYRMWQAVLKESDPKYKPVRFNRENSKSVLTSMQLAGVRVGKNGFEKDKRSEANKLIPQEDATHLSDAMDTLYIGKFRNSYGYETPIGGFITS